MSHTKKLSTKINQVAKQHLYVVGSALILTLGVYFFNQVIQNSALPELTEIESSAAANCPTNLININATKPRATVQPTRRPLFWFWFKGRSSEEERDEEREEDSQDNRAYVQNNYRFKSKCLDVGTVVYNDNSSFKFTNIPDMLIGGIYVQTGNLREKDERRYAWSATINQPSYVYILYPVKSKRIPTWLSEDYNKISPPVYSESESMFFVLAGRNNTSTTAYDIYMHNDGALTGKVSFGSSESREGNASSMYMAVFKQAELDPNAPTPTPTSSLTPTSLPTVVPTATTGATSTPRVTPSPTPLRTNSPTATPVRTNSPAPTLVPTNSPVPTPVPTLSPLQIVSSHNTRTDCWTVYNNSIYNLTPYFGAHPGGDSTLAKACGKDMTSGWNGVGSHNNQSARDMLAVYRIQP